MRIRLNTKGMEESFETLAQMGKDLDAAAGKALMAGGEVFLAGMRQRVPKDTRNLEAHLVIDGPRRDGNFQVIEVGLVKADAETARYGNAQEYGTSSMAAQPYVRPTVDADKGKATQAMRKSLTEDLAQ
jgi:HK97 gp10 family phage protein